MLTSAAVRRALALTAAATVLAGVSACGGTSDTGTGAIVSTPTSTSPYKGVTVDQQYTLPDVTLTDTDGADYNLAKKGKGRYTLLFFGYTNCPDICPTTLADLASTMRALPKSDRADIRVVFVGVDTHRDTPKVIRGFLDKFDRSFTGLTGKPADIKKAAAAAHVPYQVPEHPKSKNYVVQHGTQIVLYGPHGKSRLLFTGNTESQDITHDLKLIEKEGA